MNYCLVLFLIGMFLNGFSVECHRLPRKTEKSLPQTGNVDSSGEKHSAQDVPKDANLKPKTDATTPQTTKPKVCPAACRPQWLKLVTQYLGKVKTNQDPMCEFKSYFPACVDGSTSTCPNQVGKFQCCPLECMTEVNECWKGTGTKSICTPETVPMNWAMTMANAFFNING